MRGRRFDYIRENYFRIQSGNFVFGTGTGTGTVPCGTFKLEINLKFDSSRLQIKIFDPR